MNFPAYQAAKGLTDTKSIWQAKLLKELPQINVWDMEFQREHLVTSDPRGAGWPGEWKAAGAGDSAQSKWPQPATPRGPAPYELQCESGRLSTCSACCLAACSLPLLLSPSSGHALHPSGMPKVQILWISVYRKKWQREKDCNIYPFLPFNSKNTHPTNWNS